MYETSFKIVELNKKKAVLKVEGMTLLKPVINRVASPVTVTIGSPQHTISFEAKEDDEERHVEWSWGQSTPKEKFNRADAGAYALVRTQVMRTLYNAGIFASAPLGVPTEVHIKQVARDAYYILPDFNDGNAYLPIDVESNSDGFDSYGTANEIKEHMLQGYWKKYLNSDTIEEVKKDEKTKEDKAVEDSKKHVSAYESFLAGIRDAVAKDNLID